jgi:hypothetical protein
MEPMPSIARGKPMEVKYWTRAGLMLTDWCNAACACCYANCGPGGREWLDAAAALRIWRGLIQASPHGCRIHLTGGEPFGNFDLLLSVCRLARQEGLGPLESVETNGYWADDDSRTREHLQSLDQAGMGRLVISADPYHQQFVPIDRARRLAAVAKETLGANRVRVRWEDWLAEGCDVADLSAEQRAAVFAQYAAGGRERLTGRAADGIAGALPKHPPEAFEGDDCADRLLRGRHVHVSPTGEVWPATCVGIAIGNALQEDAPQIRARLADSWRQMSVLGPLCQRGPTGLMDAASQTGFAPRHGGYATKCQLCFDLRRHLVQRRAAPWRHQLGPRRLYEPDAPRAGAPPQS